MPLLTKTLLNDLGIVLSESDYVLLAEHFETTLNERVINEIVLELEPAQAEELSQLQNADDAEIMAWLRANVTSIEEIVADEVDILIGELADNTESISVAT